MLRIACTAALLGVFVVAASAQTTPAPAAAPASTPPAAAAPTTTAAPAKKPQKTKRQSQYDQCRDVSGRNGYGRNGPSDLCGRLFGR